MPERYRPRVGETRYFVEWCEEAVLDEFGDFDHDATTAKEKQKGFPAEAEAMAYAESVYPQACNVFGAVEVFESTFEAYDERDSFHYPHVGCWQRGRCNIYSGEWEGWN